jgi:hypothetical protein
MKYRINLYERIHSTAEVEADSVDEADEKFREGDTLMTQVSHEAYEVEVTPIVEEE